MQISKRIKFELLPFSILNRKTSKIHKFRFFAKGVKPLHLAIEFSKNNGDLPVFSKDVLYNNKVIKSYLVCSYDKMEIILNSDLEKNFYEVIRGDLPCNLYIDIDIDLTLNNTSVSELEELMNELIINIKNFMLIMNYASELNDITYICLDSTTEVKFSRHFIFRTKKGWFKNCNHCGAFLRRFANYCYELEGVSSPYNSKWWFKIKKPKKVTKNFEGGGFLIDLSIYNPNRNFRTIFSAKKGKNNPFKPFPDVCDMNLYDYFVQADCDIIEEKLLSCKEWNGMEPISTSDVTFGRFDKIINQKDFKDIHIFYNDSFNYDYVWEMFGDSKREFGFDLSTGFTRYIFFDNIESFKAYVKTKNPLSIHIGDISISKNNIRKELVFDIDLDDFTYKEKNIRLCCEGEKKLCNKCWPLLILTYEILKLVLTDIFGFENIRFYFSGSKGIHCWVFDTKVLNFNENDRNEIINFLRRDTVSRKQFFLDYVKKKDNIMNVVSEMENSGNFLKYENIDPLLYYWPRLDEGVTRQLNHLIKCPLSLHPKTHKLCSEITDFYSFSI